MAASYRCLSDRTMGGSIAQLLYRSVRGGGVWGIPTASPQVPTDSPPQVTPTVRASMESTPAPGQESATPITLAATASPRPPSVQKDSTSQTMMASACGLATLAGIQGCMH